MSPPPDTTPDHDLRLALLSVSVSVAGACLCLAIVSGCLQPAYGPGPQPTPVETSARVSHLTRAHLRARAAAAGTVAREIRAGTLATNGDVLERWNGLLDEASAVHVRDFQAAMQDASPASDAPDAAAWDDVQRGLLEVSR